VIKAPSIATKMFSAPDPSLTKPFVIQRDSFVIPVGRRFHVDQLEFM